MARNFFNNLPNTTTPLTAPRLNALLDGDEPMGNIKVDSIQTKNMIGGWFDGGIDDTTGADTATHDLRTDYIPVDFTTNSNYRISGLPNATYRNFVCAYNSSKQFLGRTGASIIATRGLNSGSFTAGTPQGTGNIAYLRVRVYSTPPESAVADVQMEVGASTTTFAQSKYLGYISGSNANGNYIKYDDGTLIQWGTIPKTELVQSDSSIYTTVQGIKFYRSNIAYHDLPIAFINSNYAVSIIVKNGSSGTRLNTTRLSTKNLNQFGIQLIGVESFTSDGTAYTNLDEVEWEAIGRWE